MNGWVGGEWVGWGGEWVGWWDDIAMTKLSVVGGGGSGGLGKKEWATMNWVKKVRKRWDGKEVDE